MICYLYECKHHGVATCKGRRNGRCLELIASPQAIMRTTMGFEFTVTIRTRINDNTGAYELPEHRTIEVYAGGSWDEAIAEMEKQKANGVKYIKLEWRP